jgi:hypothetical protein
MVGAPAYPSSRRGLRAVEPVHEDAVRDDDRVRRPRCVVTGPPGVLGDGDASGDLLEAGPDDRGRRPGSSATASSRCGTVATIGPFGRPQGQHGDARRDRLVQVTRSKSPLSTQRVTRAAAMGPMLRRAVDPLYFTGIARPAETT